MTAAKAVAIPGTEALSWIGLVTSCSALALLLHHWGLNLAQVSAATVFAASVLGTLLLWRLRLAIGAVGIGLLLITGTMDVPTLVEFMSADVIIFLVGMMIVVALLRRVGFFEYVTVGMTQWAKWKPHLLMVTFMVVAALSSALVDEVTAILLLAAIILDLCDHLDIDPTAYVIAAIVAANIGSSATVLGNPIGVLIALRAGLSFEEFLRWASPVSVAALTALLPSAILLNRGLLSLDARKVNSRLKRGVPALMKPSHMVADRRRFLLASAIFVAVLASVALHSRIESALHLSRSSVLIAASMLGAAAVLVVERKEARRVVEADVDWWNLLFFMFLFAKAGALKYTGLTEIIARGIVSLSGGSMVIVMTLILVLSATLSGFIDNIALIAAFIPIVKSFSEIGGFTLYPLWWAMLFGGTFGGNLTIVGSTANIVALSVLEKRKNHVVSFLHWLRMGITSFILALAVSWLMLYAQMPLMPHAT